MRDGENPEVNRVSGYRVLSDEELQLVNHIKALGPSLEALLARATDLAEGNGDRLRAVALAKTNLQQGFMWLIRGVAAPNGLV